MGKKNKKENKGKGKEKTAAKTEKKAGKRLKKELEAKGEEDIEKLIAEFQEKDRLMNQVIVEKCDPPSIRCNASLSSHPEKEELVMFGGEYFNGKEMFMYNELYFYNIKKNEWHKITAPGAPPPRSSHQAVLLKQGGGQLWIFGGEFANRSQSQFYHFKDLWMYSFKEKKWEKIKCVGGPSARSGHRMVAYKKMLVLFGGFNDNTRDYKYFNDVYIFNLETYSWSKIEASGKAPAPRSGCIMASATHLNKIVVYGGYSKQPIKKDLDQGIFHSDMFALIPEGKQEKNASQPQKWKWISMKQSGFRPDTRSGMSATILPGSDNILAFGGVYDQEENEETLEGHFFNDLYSLDVQNGSWHKLSVCEKSTATSEKRRRKKKADPKESGEEIDAADDDDDDEEDDADAMETTEELEQLEIKEIEADSVKKITSSDGVFTVTIGPQSSNDPGQMEDDLSCQSASNMWMPPARMNCMMAINGGHLYLYGGIYEDGDVQVTLTDFYSLDINKRNKWNTIIEMDRKNQKWEESDSSDDDKSEDDSDMDVDDDDDIPEMNEDETEEDYFERTQDFWIKKAEEVAEEEKRDLSPQQLKKLALRLCNEEIQSD